MHSVQVSVASLVLQRRRPISFRGDEEAPGAGPDAGPGVGPGAGPGAGGGIEPGAGPGAPRDTSPK